MSTHTKHSNKDTFYFVTFTCNRWLNVIEIVDLYDYFPGWTNQLNKRGVKICGFVFMPNHIHLLVFVENSSQDFNLVIGESKRFMAYEVVKRLKQQHNNHLLKILETDVTESEMKKGKLHQVFKLSFDAQEINSQRSIENVLDYFHQNPVKGKWDLVEDYLNYPHSSAGFYENGEKTAIEIFDYRTISPYISSESSIE